MSQTALLLNREIPRLPFGRITRHSADKLIHPIVKANVEPVTKPRPAQITRMLENTESVFLAITAGNRVTTEIMASTGLSKSTVYQLAEQLADQGRISIDRTSRPRIFTLPERTQ